MAAAYDVFDAAALRIPAGADAFLQAWILLLRPPRRVIAFPRVYILHVHGVDGGRVGDWHGAIDADLLLLVELLSLPNTPIRLSSRTLLIVPADSLHGLRLSDPVVDGDGGVDADRCGTGLIIR